MREFFYHISCLGIVSQGRKTVMKAVSGWFEKGLAGVRQLGPYALVELLLPGGTVFAVLLWLYRRHRRLEAHS